MGKMTSWEGIRIQAGEKRNGLKGRKENESNWESIRPTVVVKPKNCEHVGAVNGGIARMEQQIHIL
jgi:hypothetical protein